MNYFVAHRDNFHIEFKKKQKTVLNFKLIYTTIFCSVFLHLTVFYLFWFLTVVSILTHVSIIIEVHLLSTKQKDYE
jgi:hypothetical protein